MRRALPWLIAIVAVLVAVAALARLFVVRVPYLATDVGHARKQLQGLGLKMEASRSSGKGRPLDIEHVAAQQPGPGWPYLRGLTVHLTTESEDGLFDVPDLVGRYNRDAQRLLEESGFVGQSASSAGSIVVSQTPAPGARLPFGSRVAYRAVFPHSKEGTSLEVKALHGLFYLRYGVEGSNYCNPCHDGGGCAKADCHSGAAFEHLKQRTQQQD